MANTDASSGVEEAAGDTTLLLGWLSSSPEEPTFDLWAGRALGGGRGGATHGHVWSAARVSGLGDGVHQLTADAKVAQLYVAVPVQEDVGRLDVCEGDRRTDA